MVGRTDVMNGNAGNQGQQYNLVGKIRSPSVWQTTILCSILGKLTKINRKRHTRSGAQHSEWEDILILNVSLPALI